ncbi:hypothetical protein BHE74_00053920 [Ensete ventricosum]|uniref:Uncharacterized protein n=1 Tax=Ensete ventricosum TaxID=4639 RepID=A0A445MLL6_ENSVE|nr:hypothetical protein BHE74_00053920 [Ensete ventricosum]RZR75125.1 hypothetical protein BHM03_00049870 [Ensete ventricosum]
MEVVVADEGGEAEVGEVGGKCEGELDYHIVDVVGGSAGEDKVGGGGNEDTQEEEEGPGGHCVLSIGLVDAHPPKVGSEALELIINAGEVTCVRRPARQQWLDTAGGGRFHEDTSSCPLMVVSIF